MCFQFGCMLCRIICLLLCNPRRIVRSRLLFKCLCLARKTLFKTEAAVLIFKLIFFFFFFSFYKWKTVRGLTGVIMCSMNLIFLAQNSACVMSDSRIIKACDKEGIGRGLSWCVFPHFTGRAEEMHDRRK